jgi:hypothetical protein
MKHICVYCFVPGGRTQASLVVGHTSDACQKQHSEFECFGPKVASGTVLRGCPDKRERLPSGTVLRVLSIPSGRFARNLPVASGGDVQEKPWLLRSKQRLGLALPAQALDRTDGPNREHEVRLLASTAP